MSNKSRKTKKKKKSLDGEKKFHNFYSGVYGERWETLKTSLLKEKEHILLANPYSDFKCSFKPWFDFPNAYVAQEELESPGNGPLAPYYFMDGASYLAPYFLNPQKGDKVLDLCAAPGGKSLVLAYMLKGLGHLTSNDKSMDRRLRMQRVLRGYLPENIMEESVRITGFDASGWCLYEQEAYDKILLDVPCSSEKHVLQSSSHLNEWSEKRTKKLAALQWKMLASSWLVLRPGGRLVYSTCSISPYENDTVVEKLTRKFEVNVIKDSFDGGEETEYGKIFLPDQSNLGPFYLSILEKPIQ